MSTGTPVPTHSPPHVHRRTSTTSAANFAPRRRRRLRTRFAACLSWRGLLMRRKNEIEACAARLIGAIPESRVMRLDDGPADREAEPRSGRLGREERLEDLLLHLTRQAGSKVADRYLDVGCV